MPLLLLICLWVFGSVTGLSAQTPTRLPAADRVVVLITLDGFPSWIWKDPALVMPNLRRIAARGAVAENMTVSNPTATWINHTTLVTGVQPSKHGVLFNGLLTRQGPDQPPLIDPLATKADLVRTPTLYDLAFRAGLKTAQVAWVAVAQSGSFHVELAEIPRPHHAFGQELVAQGILTATQLAGFTASPHGAWRDTVRTQAAAHILRTRAPNLLLLHLLNTDTTNHISGPGSNASFTAYAYADRLIGDFFEALNAAGFQDRATVFITTDHGFKKVSRLIYPNVALREAGLLQTQDGKINQCAATVIAQGGMAMVFVTDPARRAALLPSLKSICSKLEGVAAVIDPRVEPMPGLPTPEQNPGMGDLLLLAQPGSAFQPEAHLPAAVADAKTPLGAHGYPHTDPDLDGLLVAWGYGIRSGTTLNRIRNVDVAPTLAQLLELQLPDTDGRVLEEILDLPR
jgi:predicted AlkP superfamily pyrophosphatase or phosphodiesterase